MMKLTSRISMCLSIDASNSIAYYDRPLNYHAPKELKKIDYAILNRYLQMIHDTVRSYVVIGEKTYNDMKNLQHFERLIDDTKTEFFVISKEKIERRFAPFDHLHETVLEHPQSNEQVFNTIMHRAITNKKDNIFVLGGARVYDAFYHNADEICVGTYDVALCMADGKTIDQDIYAMTALEDPQLTTTSENIEYNFYHLKNDL